MNNILKYINQLFGYDVDKMDYQLHFLRKEIAAIRNNLDQSTSEIETGKSKIKQLQYTENILRKKVSDLEENLNIIKQEKLCIEQNLASVIDEKNTVNSAYLQTKAEKEELTEKFNKQRVLEQYLAKETEQLRACKVDLVEQIANLKKELDETILSKNTYKKDCISKHEESDRLQDSIQSWAINYNSLDHKYNEVVKAKSLMKNELSILQRQLDNALQDKDDFATKCLKDEEECATLRAQLNELHDNMAKYQELELLYDSQQNEIEKLQNELKGLNEERESVLAQYEEKSVEFKSLDEVYKNQSKEIEELTEKCESLKMNTCSREELLAAEKHNQSLEEEIADRKQEYDKLSLLQTEEKAKYDTLLQKYNELRAASSDLKDQLLSSREASEKQQASLIWLQQRVNELLQENNSLKEREDTLLSKEEDMATATTEEGEEGYHLPGEETDSGATVSNSDESVSFVEESGVRNDGGSTDNDFNTPSTIAENHVQQGEGEETVDVATLVSMQTTEPPTNPQTVGVKVTNVKKSSHIEQAVKQCGDSIENLPEITNNNSRQSYPTIPYVYDENDQLVYSDKFFNEETSPEEIAKVSRKLSEAAIKGEIYWKCGSCGNRVKIGYRKSTYGETLFFFHADKNVDCEWVHTSQRYKNLQTLMSEDELAAQLEEYSLEENKRIQQDREYKQLLYRLLTSGKSIEMGISDVQLSPCIRSNNSYMKWRRPDLYFQMNDQRMVLLLQKPSHTLDELVNRDIFYRLNDIHVIWIFTNETNNDYAFINQFNYKNTLFDNHRNVFLFDREAQDASLTEDVLYLKCNWLDEYNQWAIKVDENHSNGKLISLDMLTFDNEYCKPYYVDANRVYFSKNPDALQVYNESRKTREQLLVDLENKWTNNTHYQEAIQIMKESLREADIFSYNDLWGFRFNTTLLINTVFTQCPIRLENDYWSVCKNGHWGIVDKYGQKVVDWEKGLVCDELQYDDTHNRLIFKKGKWGIADVTGNALISAVYDQLLPWDENIYRAKLGNKWGLVNCNDEVVTDFKYESIGILVNNRAKALIVHSKYDAWCTFTGYLDNHGCPIVTEEKQQADGTLLIQEFGLWGMYDEHTKQLLAFDYEEITPWADKLYRVKLNGRCGIFDTSSSSMLLPIEYNSIGELFDGRATVEKQGQVSCVNKKGEEIAQEEQQLQHGWKKTMVAGKWGVEDKDGKEIVPHKYDEIGSFRNRLVGVINQRLVKLAVYEYPIFIKGEYVGVSEKQKKVVNIAGVQCFLTKQSTCKEVKEACDAGRLGFMNLMYHQQKYQLRILTKNKLTSKLSHGDQETDYCLNEELEGTIESINTRINRKTKTKQRRRMYVKFANEKSTIIAAADITRSGKDINLYKIGETIRLKKTGFDDENDRTVWEVLV